MRLRVTVAALATCVLSVTTLPGDAGAGDAVPEITTNASGTPSGGDAPYAEVRGLLDTHVHLMSFEFLGGRAHCGRPWHRDGPAAALVDCPDHGPNGYGALFEAFVSNDYDGHDTSGWPFFAGWPTHGSKTHEQTYYRWVERTWRGGLRLMVVRLVENEILCKLYPLKRNACDETQAVRLQAQRVRELEAFIDAKSGGTGKGWFRIVRDPFEARRVINQGKLAVVLGMEISKPFGCDVRGDVPECDRPQIDRELDALHRLGVRDLPLANKFDNALGGVAFDGGEAGVLINAGNRLQTGEFWSAETCTGSASDSTLFPYGGEESRDAAFGRALSVLLPKGADGAVPLYPPAPHCNTKGLSALGVHAIERIAAKGMILDIDHLSARAQDQALSVIERLGYSGVVSSHSWADESFMPRVLRAGGVVGPYSSISTNWVATWQRLREQRDPRYYFGIGFGPDAGGLGALPGPRPLAYKDPVRYPFTSFDGKVRLDRQRSGERVFDINTDGIAHYGLYPDWVEDVRIVGGRAPVEDLARGAEAYLQMWERAAGVRSSCLADRATVTSTGLGSIRLGDDAKRLLRGAGQPISRGSRVWTYCVRGAGARTPRVKVVLTSGGQVGLVASTVAGHAAGGIVPGAPTKAIAGRTHIAPDVRVHGTTDGGRYVYGLKSGRVAYVGVVADGVSDMALLDRLAVAGLR